MIYDMETKTKSNITSILFDMVGVLLFKRKGYSSNSKSQINAEKIERLYNHTDDKKLISDIKEKLKLSDKKISDALYYIPARYEKFTKIWELLPKLKKNYKLAVINNGNSLANNYWFKRFDFSIFDLFINSGVEGTKKPDPKIFLLACKKLDVNPESCLFMDDNEENITTAKSLGMKTIWWKPSEVRNNFRLFLKLYQ